MPTVEDPPRWIVEPTTVVCKQDGEIRNVQPPPMDTTLLDGKKDGSTPHSSDVIDFGWGKLSCAVSSLTSMRSWVPFLHDSTPRTNTRIPSPVDTWMEGSVCLHPSPARRSQGSFNTERRESQSTFFVRIREEKMVLAPLNAGISLILRSVGWLKSLSPSCSAHLGHRRVDGLRSATWPKLFCRCHSWIPSVWQFSELSVELLVVIHPRLSSSS